MADFAKAQLMKYGWTEGKGLGKNENGITTALKPALKFDTAGIGHKHVDGNQWWETAFNKAANNITVGTNTNGVSISVTEKDSDDTFKQKSKKKRLKSDSQYANFLKISTLCNGNLLPENISPANVEVESVTNDVALVQLTDEELFKACGGRTAHKGARHGLKLNGKLERIARQEEELLNKVLSSSSNQQATYQHKVVNKSSNLSKKNESSDEDNCKTPGNENSDLPLYTTSVEDSELGPQSKKTKRKQKRKINDLTYQLDTLCKVNDSTVEEQLALKAEKNKEKAKKRKVKEHNTNAIAISCKDDWVMVKERADESDINNKKNLDKSKRRRSDCKKEAERLNNKIKKKKDARRRRKAKLKLGHLIEESQPENSDTKSSSKFINSQKKIERIVKDLTSIEIVDDVTEKKLKKKV